MNQQSTLEQLQHLKLPGMSRRYNPIIRQPVHQQPEPHAMVALLAEAETSYRIHQRDERICDWLNSGITPPLNKINFSPDRGITKEILFTLSGGTFIEKSENLLFTGLEFVIANFVE